MLYGSSRDRWVPDAFPPAMARWPTDLSSGAQTVHSFLMAGFHLSPHIHTQLLSHCPCDPEILKLWNPPARQKTMEPRASSCRSWQGWKNIGRQSYPSSTACWGCSSVYALGESKTTSAQGITWQDFLWQRCVWVGGWEGGNYKVEEICLECLPLFFALPPSDVQYPLAIQSLLFQLYIQAVFLFSFSQLHAKTNFDIFGFFILSSKFSPSLGRQAIWCRLYMCSPAKHTSILFVLQKKKQTKKPQEKIK